MSDLHLPQYLRDTLPEKPGAYLVGGAVRDLLLERRPTDIDIAVENGAAAFAQDLAERIGARVVSIGKHGLVNHRVTSRYILIDVTDLVDQSLESDLRRRDFTVNAMAVSLHDGRLIDISGGREDIAGRHIRMVSEKAFVEDPLRLLRAFRLAGTLEFEIEANTLAAIRRHGQRINQPAGERLHAEFIQLLNCPASSEQIRAMSKSGLLTRLFPEMEPMQGCLQNRHHDFDVSEHTLNAYAAVEDSLRTTAPAFAALRKRYRQAPFRKTAVAILKYAALLHDIGKPSSRHEGTDGGVHFHGHARHSAEMAEAVHRRLCFSKKESEQAQTIILNHGRPMDLLAAHKSQNLRRKGINRFYRECDPWTPEVLLHAWGDTMGKRRKPDAEVDATLHFITGLIDDYFDRYRPLAGKKPLVNGRDLMRHCGLAPSPIVGELLQSVEEERLAGRITTRREALQHAAACLAQRDRSASETN